MRKSPGNPDPRRTEERLGLLEAWRVRIERRLDELLPPETMPPPELHRAMRYAVRAGGKRLRPLLVMAAAETMGRAEQALDGACAVEFVHTYSLVHDDLPCMDDDDFRRGQPSCHRAFGEAVALLAGNALLALSFEVLLSYPSALAHALVRELARAAGSTGLAGGQVGDLLWPADEYSYTFVASAKTGALFRACLRLGGLIAGAGEATLSALDDCGRHLSLAFQLADDLADWTRDREKGRGMNAVAVWGPEGCRHRALAAKEAAESILAGLGEGAFALRLVANQALAVLA
ncbi:MAG TPA: polyprenyl synthetase family protein [Firmicutes bacterium]|nr:polyprenyl synthetase family protein [Bacillota bacterium]